MRYVDNVNSYLPVSIMSMGEQVAITRSLHTSLTIT